MLSVIIETQNSEKPLTHTLSALVPAVVEGLVRRVLVIDKGSSDETALVAIGAGCSFSDGADKAAALSEIRTPWVLVLAPGAIPQDGWEEVARRHMEGTSDPARFTLAGERGLGGLKAAVFGKGPTLDAGLLVRLDMIKPLILDGMAFAGLPRQMKPVRLKHGIHPPTQD
ncbi:glycosyl transferase [Ochrobactrum soli]|uniref:Glycosyl transferase n=2 Tax=Ochrobactrum TaxID=528 RepID=A0A2P9HKD5_9HYPH|nr:MULTISPECIES: glycosyl transferase [Brucella]RRD28092.1 glycosyl transferase [Brucellaceae bacterium VT-16-1752]WHT41053.1 glycosyl transferase [Ochrobactrum sp. SSR]MDX4076004.1 glycosyl transferase [Brucella sp. NBRC 113783]NNU58726.1 glycosyl transferase [[Ochrobactrum] soli]RLL75395.1 glycosyl transferase [[Ochrobactrum] soli]